MPAHSVKVEMLAEAIINHSGYSDPKSALFQARNPGGLKATSMKHIRDEHGNRVFNSFIDGVQALLFDLDTKLSGKSWAKLTETSTLKDLAAAYSLVEATATGWSRFLRAALNDTNIRPDTQLSVFTEKGKQ